MIGRQRQISTFPHLRYLLLALLFLCLEPDATSAAEAAKPNFICILADDLGYGDLACYGHPHVRTPHLDRLARDGLRLTSCYSAGANCSPSRCGLMTGRTPYRAGIHNQIPMLSPMHLRAEEITVASLLKAAGYSTCHVGKWHLNGMFNLPGQPQPGDHGFAHWFSTQNNCLPNHRDPYNFVRNGIPVGPQEGHAASLVADEAIHWLKSGRDKSQPFFLYVCFHEPHEPIRPDPRLVALYDLPDDPSRAAYYASIAQMDEACGRLFAALEEFTLADNTLVWFTSDNGPARTKWHNAGSAGPLREFKGHLYEGGIRVPGIIRWPGRVKAGGINDTPVCGVDLLPTLCQIANVAPPTDRPLDGTSILPLLEVRKFSRDQPLYWQFIYAQSDPAVALRDGDWKILSRTSERPARPMASITDDSNRALKSATLAGYELYNLKTDIGETTDLASREPEKLRELTALVTARFEEVQRDTPVWPVWEDPRYEQGRIEWPDYVAKPLHPAPAAPRK
jgi:arylsulfatase A